jgi:hypothetical protein
MSKSLTQKFSLVNPLYGYLFVSQEENRLQ